MASLDERTLDQQIEQLIEQAPRDDVTGMLIALMAPLLKQIAGQLQYFEYFVLQTPDRGWVVTTLGHRATPELEKTVVYAFPDLQDAQAVAGTHTEVDLVPLNFPVISIIFQLIALKQVESILFFERAGDRQRAVEVRRVDLEAQMQQIMRQQLQQPPPNLA
ncbi:MAG: hypothetical protein HC824_07950 [Synechococcales cyanobacterium RM1_1_8]|nr:hypothetical protein [Synechococcales cyanobacterium RM1_1_8]